MNDLSKPRRCHGRAGAVSCLLVLLLAGCSAGTTAGTSAGTVGAEEPAPDSDGVLAVVDGIEVTLADLEDTIGDRLGQMDFQYRSQRHEVISSATRRFVRDRLFEAEAEERGVSVDALLAEVLGEKVSVTDDEVRSFYAQNQASLAGRPFEAIAPQIRTYLEGQIRESVLQEYAEGLAEGREVEYLLGPFRVAIDVGGAPSYGPDDAAVTLVEFSDFECPYCQSFVPTLEQVKQAYGDDVRIVFLQFPLREIHPLAQKAAEASLCAHEQGKFWETHDLYFAEQDRLSEVDLREKAERLGLDTDSFDACLTSGKYVDAIDADIKKGIAVGVTGTPAVFINGRPLPGGAVPFSMVANVIDEELEGR